MIKEVRGNAAMGFLTTRPTMIITTLHESGIVNAGVFGAWTNLSPEHVGVAISVASDTYRNILRGKEFTINIPGADLVKAIAPLAAKVPIDRSELEDAHLTAKPGLAIETPSIAECVAAAEFTFFNDVPVASHHFVIGTCVAGWIREEYLDADGKLDIFKARIFKDHKYPKPLYVTPGEVIEG